MRIKITKTQYKRILKEEEEEITKTPKEQLDDFYSEDRVKSYSIGKTKAIEWAKRLQQKYPGLRILLSRGNEVWRVDAEIKK